MKKLYSEESVIEIANAIRSKTDSVETMCLSQMADKILEIPTGGDTSIYLDEDPDGKTLVEIEIGDYDTKDMCLVIGGNGSSVCTFNIDWGDDTVTTNQVVYQTGNLPVNHTYTDTGAYLIKIWGNADFKLGYYSSSYRNIVANQPNKDNSSSYQTPLVRRIRCGDGCVLGNFACYYLPNLLSVWCGDGEKVGERCFSNSGVKHIHLPDNLKSVTGNMLYCNIAFNHIKIPKTVTSVMAYAFYATTSCMVYDFSELEQVPSLSSANAFSYCFADGVRKIVVPDNLYDDWIASSNWSAYAGMIVKKSEA